MQRVLAEKGIVHLLFKTIRNIGWILGRRIARRRLSDRSSFCTLQSNNAFFAFLRHRSTVLALLKEFSNSFLWNA
jgi:hypothetical protein